MGELLKDSVVKLRRNSQKKYSKKSVEDFQGEKSSGRVSRRNHWKIIIEESSVGIPTWSNVWALLLQEYTVQSQGCIYHSLMGSIENSFRIFSQWNLWIKSQETIQRNLGAILKKNIPGGISITISGKITGGILGKLLKYSVVPSG